MSELIVNNLASNTSIEAISLTQQHNLSVSDVTSNSTIDDIALIYPSYLHILSLANVVSTTHIESPTVSIILHFPWFATGYVNEFGVTEISQTVRHNYPGYTATRPKTTKMQKKFSLKWHAMTNEQWLALITFWRMMRGGMDEFYFEFPIGLYGAGSFGGGEVTQETGDGFDSFLRTGYGSGPMFLVRFENDELPQGYRNDAALWTASANMIEVD